MLEISNNGIITMSRGDYAEIPLFINQGNQMYPIRYSLLKDDKSTIAFAIMTPQQQFEQALIKKIYTSKTFAIYSFPSSVLYESYSVNNQA